MRVNGYKKREDGSFDFENPIIVESENLPEDVFLPDSNKIYNELGYEITLSPIETEPQEPSLEERIQALEAMELERILGGGF